MFTWKFFFTWVVDVVVLCLHSSTIVTSSCVHNNVLPEEGSVVVAMLYVLLCSTEPRYIESGILDCVVGCADVQCINEESWPKVTHENAYCVHILYPIEYTHNLLLSYCQFIGDSRDRITHIHHTRTMGLYSLSGRTSYRKISWSIKAASVWIRLLFGGKTSCRLL